jgi:phospholipid/cholesterol/gamma-HCH transport system permease protein
MITQLNTPLLQTAAIAGSWAVRLFWYAGSLCLLFAQTVGITAQSLNELFTRPLRAKAVVSELLKIGVQSSGIVFLSSLFIGMVLAFQSAYQMQKLAAEIYIASLVALSVVREIGPVITALIVAGRVGSSIAAELGTMKVTEQLDAMMSLAADPVRYLVVPRFIALIIALPLLTLWADAIGILGGFLVGTVKLGILPSLYWKMTTLPLAFKDLFSGLLKAFIFGMIICVVSCFEGFRTEGGAEGVGRSTTIAVVASFLLIIAADCLCTALFYFVWR